MTSTRNYTFRLMQKGQEVQRYQSHRIRAFLSRIRTATNFESGQEVYLRVSYGKGKNVLGQTVNFYNDGTYTKEEDLWQAFNAFTEPGVGNTEEEVQPAAKPSRKKSAYRFAALA